MQKEEQAGAHKLSAAKYSIGANAGLILLKLVVAILTGSLGLLAELMHSGFDMIASLLAYYGIKKANEPADESHPYGHERFENISSLLQTVLIVVTSVLIAYEAIQRIVNPVEISMGEIGIIAMLVTIGIDFFVAKKLHSASKEHSSSALEADAYHFSSDLWSAGAVIVGLVFTKFGFPIFDSIAALVVAAGMLKLSFSLGMKSVNVLSDKAADENTLRQIKEVLDAFVANKKITHYHKVKTRHIGSKLLIDLHMQVENSMTVDRSHEIAHEIKNELAKKISLLKDTTIHIEPAIKYY